MKYQILSNSQMFVLAILISIICSAASFVNTWYSKFTQLPVVSFNKAGDCVMVDNFKNGDAFTCADVGVLLRQYRSQVQ